MPWRKRTMYLYFQVICNFLILRNSCHELKSDNLNLTSTTGCPNKITSNNVSQCSRLFPAPADLSTHGSEATGLELLTSDRCSQLTKQWCNCDFQSSVWGLFSKWCLSINELSMAAYQPNLRRTSKALHCWYCSH